MQAGNQYLAFARDVDLQDSALAVLELLGRQQIALPVLEQGAGPGNLRVGDFVFPAGGRTDWIEMLPGHEAEQHEQECRDRRQK